MADEETPAEAGPSIEDVPVEVPKAAKKPKPSARKKASSTGKVVVAEGKSISCSRFHGIKGPGEEITADLFIDGQAAVDNLLEKGYLVRA